MKLRPALLAIPFAAACGGEAPPPATPNASAAPADDLAARASRCTEGKLDPRARARTLQDIVEAKYAGGEACVARTLRDDEPGKTDEEFGWACRAVAVLSPKSAAEPLFAAFTKFRASSSARRGMARDLRSALSGVADPKWTPALLTRLDAPIPTDSENALDELFWQATAADLLGQLGAAEAVRPLVKVLVSAPKRDVQPSALLAIARIGKAAEAPALAMLKGQDSEIVALGAAERARGAAPFRAPHVLMAGIALGSIGRSSSIPPMLEAIAAGDDDERTILVGELPNFPKRPETVAAFRAAVEKTAPKAVVEPTMRPARRRMVEATPLFFDPNLVPWLASTTEPLRGSDEDLSPLREAAYFQMLKLATPAHKAVLDRFAKLTMVREGKQVPLSVMFAVVRVTGDALLKECGEKPDCYVEAATSPETTAFRAIKGAVMAGVYADGSTRDKLVEALPRIEVSYARSVALLAVQTLTPEGDVKVASALERMGAEAEAQPAAGASTALLFRIAAARLRARVP